MLCSLWTLAVPHLKFILCASQNKSKFIGSLNNNVFPILSTMECSLEFVKPRLIRKPLLHLQVQWKDKGQWLYSKDSPYVSLWDFLFYFCNYFDIWYQEGIKSLPSMRHGFRVFQSLRSNGSTPIVNSIVLPDRLFCLNSLEVSSV